MFQKKLSKTVLAVMAFAVISVHAQEGFSVSFENELGSDVVNVTKDGDTTKSTFAGFYNETVIDFESEKVTAGIDAKFQMNVDSDGNPESFAWVKEDFDWYATFSPISVLTLGLSDDIFMDGSYLIIEDDNVAGGKLGSDGVSVSVTAIPNLTIAATVPFGFDSDSEVNYFSNSDTYFNFGFGAEYDFEKGKIGAVMHNPCNTEVSGFGIYGSFTGVENLSVNAGFAYRDADTLLFVTDNEDYVAEKEGDNYTVNASASYGIASFIFAADYVTTFNQNFYGAAQVGYNIIEPLTVSVTGTTFTTYDEFSKGTFCLKPAVVYVNEKLGEFSVEADITFVDGEFSSLTFPVYWKYSF